MSDTLFDGSTLSVVSGEPASFDEGGFEGLSYVKIANVQDIDSLGDTQSAVTYTTLEDGRLKRLPSTKDGGVRNLTVIYDSDDDVANKGQGIIRAASGGVTVHSFKVKDADGQTYYFTGLVADFQWAARATGTVKMFTVNLYVNSAIYGPYSD